MFAVNLTTGAALWTNTDIRCPQGIVSYGSEHLLVNKDSNKTELWILNVNTGKITQHSVDSPLLLSDSVLNRP